MPARASVRAAAGAGLGDLRRRGTITELLFLYECTTTDASQLRPIAEKLGLTVQAVSHSYRQLARRGLAEVRDGRYRATVEGIAWLHQALGLIRDDVSGRLAHLDVVRSTRAIAGADLALGTRVTLELVEGLLTARPGGTGPSRGTARTAARRGEIAEIDRLEGILPIAPGRVRVLVVPSSRLHDAKLPSRLADSVRRAGPALLAAQGLEGFHLLRRAVDRPVVRFAVAAACREASQVGVDSLVVALDTELPRLLDQFSGTAAPPVDVTPVR